MAGRKRKRSEGGVMIRDIRARTQVTDESLHSVMHNASDEYGAGVDTGSNRDCGSCGTHFPSPEAYRHHRDVKLLNKTAKFVPSEKIRKNAHHLLCPVIKCCYSAKTKGPLKVGYRFCSY